MGNVHKDIVGVPSLCLLLLLCRCVLICMTFDSERPEQAAAKSRQIDRRHDETSVRFRENQKTLFGGIYSTLFPVHLLRVYH